MARSHVGCLGQRLCWFDVALPWLADRAFAHTLKEIHELLAHALMALAVLHAPAALLHHVVIGDRTWPRMLPGR